MANRLAIPRGSYTRQQLVVVLRDSIGLSWGAIAEIVYGERRGKAKLKAYALYITAKRYTPGDDDAIPEPGYTGELVPERGWQQRASPSLTGATLGTLPGKWGRRGDGRYLEEAAEILRYFYDLVMARYDFDKSVLAYAEELLRKNSELLRDERIHIKRGYIKLTPRVAAVIYACFFAATYNLARSQSALQDLFYHFVQYLSQTQRFRGDTKKAREALQKELEKVMPQFVRYLVPP